MAYDKAANKAVLKYKKEKQHPISLSYRQEEYENRIRPAIEASGLPVATYIKQAVDEKILRDRSQKPRTP